MQLQPILITTTTPSKCGCVICARSRMFLQLFCLVQTFQGDNSFESLVSEGDYPGRPLHTSSPFSVHLQRRKKSTKRRLKFLSMNCNGLKSNSKKVTFNSMIDLHQPDVTLGCETKIDPSVPIYSIFPDTRKDTSLSGGGVFIAVTKSLIAVEESLFYINGCEIIGVSTQLARLKNYL